MVPLLTFHYEEEGEKIAIWIKVKGLNGNTKLTDGITSMHKTTYEAQKVRLLSRVVKTFYAICASFFFFFFIP